MMRVSAFYLALVAANAGFLFVRPFSLARLFICVGICAAGNGAILYLLFHPRSQWFVGSRSRVDCTDGRWIALTFDDGPTASHTPRLLQILREKNVKASFFVIGARAEVEPDLMRQMIAEGHVVANHTYSHPNLFCFLGPGRLRDEIRRGQEAITKACGTRPRYFRSPVGLKHPLLSHCLREVGLEYVSWEVKSFDTLERNAENVARRILRKTTAGDIILLHDIGDERTDRMLKLLPALVDSLRHRGFEFVLV